jgi:MFS transporter, ACS family, solute carrier family 17 (sodium-dependent inorganic phosphate cotransporter), other
MAEEFAFSDTIKGSISSLFSVGYGLAILPAGLVLSVLSPRNVMAFGVLTWSVATILTPTSADFLAMDSMVLPLLLARACVGAGESLVIPTTQKLLAVWTSPSQKALALAFIFSGFQTGTIGAYLLSPIVMDSFGGWRSLFYVYGSFGLLLLLPWLLLARDAPSAIAQTKGYAKDTEDKSKWDVALQTFRDAPWSDFASSKGTWGMLLAHAAKNWGLYITLAWTPTFYAEQYGIGIRDSAWLSLCPSVAGAVGGFFAGTTADTILRNLNDITVESKTNLRKGFQAVGLLGPALALGWLATNIPEEAWVAQYFLTAALGLQSFNAAGFEAGNQEKAGPKWAGMLYSVTSLPAVLGKFHFPVENEE